MSRNKKLGILISIIIGIIIAIIILFKTQTHIYLNKTNVNLYIGEKTKLELKNTNKKPQWSSKNNKVATIKEGEIVAKSSGTTNVYAKLDHEIYTCHVKVTNKEKLNKSKLIMVLGDEEKIYIENSTRHYKWSSSDSNIASVKDGYVKALNIGEAKIIAQYNDEEYVCHITVIAAVTNIKIPKWESQYYLGEDNLHIDQTVLDVTYHDGSKKRIKLTKDMCSEYNLQQEGKQSVKISYGGYELRKEINVKAFQFSPTPTGDFTLQAGESKTIAFNIPQVLENKEVAKININNTDNTVASFRKTNQKLIIEAKHAGKTQIKATHLYSHKSYIWNVVVNSSISKVNNLEESINIPLDQSLDFEVRCNHDVSYYTNSSQLFVHTNGHHAQVSSNKAGIYELVAQDNQTKDRVFYQIHVDNDIVLKNDTEVLNRMHLEATQLGKMKRTEGTFRIYLADDYSPIDIDDFLYDNNGSHLGDFYKEDMLLKVKSLKRIYHPEYREYIITLDPGYWNWDMRIAYEKKLQTIYQNLALDGLTDEQKVRRIHDYVCSHADYDYATYYRNQAGHPIDYAIDNYSSYDILFDSVDSYTGSTRVVCTGFAGLFYRLAKKSGLDVMSVTGTTSGSMATNHIWNVVKVEGKYYYIDCTWDGGEIETNYDDYLKGKNHFPGHVLDKRYEFLPIQNENMIG